MRRPLTSAAFGWRPEWTARALALFRADDDRFTDEEILTILRAGEAGLKIPDVCAAGGIRTATYYALEGQIRRPDAGRREKPPAARPQETPDHHGRLRGAGRPQRRRSGHAPRDSQRFTATEGGRRTRPRIPSRRDRHHPRRPRRFPPWSALENAAAGGALQSTPVRQPSQGADAAQSAGVRASAPWVNAEDIETAEPSGYVVQVAAVPDLQEARAVLDQLAEAGYPAYLTATVIDRVELYRVRVGPLKSRRAAEDVARRLEREGHRAPWVTK